MSLGVNGLPAAAPKAAPDPEAKGKIDGLAGRLAARARANKLEPGQAVRHERHGEVLAECTYLGPREWVYRGKAYTSISAAANAAAEKIGMVSKTLNGWWFWGVEKRG